jgi:hypothetical protein
MPRAFAHPGFYCALGVLLLNDHVWKGGGMLPGALTGKLSDFAGMVVAPPLAALLLGAGRPRARLLATALVGAGFAAINLLPAAAAVLEGALRLLHVPSRVWVDPTDLWALALLPFGYALCEPDRGPARRVPDWLPRAGVVLSAIACIATTGADEKESSTRGGPEVENDTGEKVAVVVAATEGAGGCSLYRDDRVSLLRPAAFTGARHIELAASERSDLTRTEGGVRCGAASIELPNGSGVRVFWRNLETIETFAPADDDRRRARRVIITGEPGRYRVEVGKDLTVFELGAEPPPEPTCPDPEVAHSLEFTALAEAQGYFEVGEIRTGADGCLEVDWFALRADTSPDIQRLCIPEWAFPFEVGAQLSVIQEIDPLGAQTLSIALREGGGLDTELVIWNRASTFGGGRVRSLRARDCVGALTECGAYTRAVELEIRDRDDRIGPGDELTLRGGGAAETRLLVGTAQDVAWTAPNCQGSDARPGTSANVLELRTY